VGKTRKAPKVLTLDEAADYLRVSPEAVARQAGLGQIPGRLIEGEWRFSRGALEDWLGSGFRTAAATRTEEGVRGSPETLLQQTGRLAHDPDADSLLEDIYARRGRPEVDRGAAQ